MLYYLQWSNEPNEQENRACPMTRGFLALRFRVDHTFSLLYLRHTIRVVPLFKCFDTDEGKIPEQKTDLSDKECHYQKTNKTPSLF